VTIDVDGAVANDEALNDNAAATQLLFRYDTESPTVTLTSTQASETNENPVEFTATFSEGVINFVLNDVTVTSAVAFTKTDFVNVDDTVNEVFTFKVNMDADGDFSISIDANACTDPATNPNVASSTLTYTVDFFPPTPTLSSDHTDNTYTNTLPIPITMTLSEAPDTSTIASDDFTLTHTGGSVTVSDSPGLGLRSRLGLGLELGLGLG